MPYAADVSHFILQEKLEISQLFALNGAVRGAHLATDAAY